MANLPITTPGNTTEPAPMEAPFLTIMAPASQSLSVLSFPFFAIALGALSFLMSDMD